MKVGILGSGQVAQVLGAGFMQHGHAVMLGTREPASSRSGRRRTTAPGSGTFAEAAAFGDVLVLAVKGPRPRTSFGLAGAGEPRRQDR